VIEIIAEKGQELRQR